MVRLRNAYVVGGAAWCVLFALMSFYWASGGMLGVKSLGGSIEELALKREPSFIAIVWVTGIVKLAGGLFLMTLLKKWSVKMSRFLYLLALTGGILLVLYGFTNMLTLVLSTIGVLTLQVDPYALKSRLFFWEPFWIIGGLLFILSALQFRKGMNARLNRSVSE